ncbi:MAG: cysteine desulfurase family protein [Minisyncoccales bacterium]|jgi:cysteine desulfurase
MDKRVYLDNAATTKVDDRVLEAMEPYFQEKYGNTMSLHSFGQEARIALDKSRETVADMIGSNSDEIIFTSSATESNNFVMKGIASANFDKGKHLIISSIEHPCIMESALWLERRGFEITRLKVDSLGRVNPENVREAIREDTVLVSIIHASNEIGTIQPISEIGKICKEKGVYFHTDSTQILGKESIDVSNLNVDMLTASAHKMYGPKGIGILFLKKGTKIDPLLHGGGQESDMRSSTINLPLIVGFAKACEISSTVMEKENERIKTLRDKIIDEALKIKDTKLNGDPCNRLSNNINLRFDFIEGESLVISLDMLGIATSTGSACSSNKLQPSHVLLAIGLKPQEAHGSLRISLGRWTTSKEVDYFLKNLPAAVEKLREISPFGRR